MTSVEEWNRFSKVANGEFDPPEGPSDQDLARYRQALVDHLGESAARVVILGCTPGLRRLFVEEPRLSSCLVSCVDWSQLMYERTTETLPATNPNESFLQADWLDMDLGAETVSAVIADQSINQLHGRDWSRLLDNVHRGLEPGGLFLQRVEIADESLRGKSFEALLSKWVRCAEGGAVPWLDVVLGLWHDCVSGSVFLGDSEEPTRCAVRHWDAIEACRLRLSTSRTLEGKLVDGLLLRFDAERFAEVLPACLLEDLTRVIEAGFEVGAPMHSADYGAAAHPLISAWRRR